MNRRLLLLCVALPLMGQTPAIPDTPAGHTLQAWFDAFNSGDRQRIEAHLAKYGPDVSLDAQMNFRSQTGGFDLVRIEKSERLSIEFVVKEKNRGLTALGKMTVSDPGKDGTTARATAFNVRAIPPGKTAADMNIKVDAATRARVIDGAMTYLTEYYVFADTAKKMADAVQARFKSGAYDSITDGSTFASTLTSDLRDVSHDKHLQVGMSVEPLPVRDPNAAPSAEALSQRRTQMARNNCAFERVERMASNIGYLKFNGFLPPDDCKETVNAAMNFIAHVDALIIDLRENGGGDPKMVAYIASFLFGDRTHLNDLYNRKEDKTTEFWTESDVPGARLAGKPIFVLTSKRTFSGGEEFTYDLKNLKRATIIGETTGGGAHPVSSHRIDDHFFIGVPFARAINPYSKTNWEGTGVEPDVKVPAAEALDVAKKMATEKIAAQQPQRN